MRHKISSAMCLLACASLVLGCAQEARKPTAFAEALANVSTPQIDMEFPDLILAEHGGRFQDPEIQAYVDQIASRLFRIVDPSTSDIDVTILNSALPLAAAGANADIYISRGMLALADSEAEVAAALAHEVAHLMADHRSSDVGLDIATRRALEAGLPRSAADLVFGQGAYEKATAGSLTASAARSYSHEQEYEADRFATKYLDQAGYNPSALIGLFQRYQAFLWTMGYDDDVELISNKWLDTHPTTPERIDRLVGHLQSFPPSASEGGRNRHLDVTDGLLWGSDPKLGFQEGGGFFHPGLGISFNVPPGFTSGGTLERYLARDGLSRFLVAYETKKDFEAEVGQYETAPNVRVERFSGREFPAVSVIFSLRESDAQLSIMSAQVETGPDTFIRFDIIQLDKLTDLMARQYRDMIKSVRFLPPREKIDTGALEITSVEVDTDQSFESWAATHGYQGKLMEIISVLNSLDLGKTLVAGQRIRVIDSSSE